MGYTQFTLSDEFLRIAGWIVKHIKDCGDFGLIEFDFPFPVYGLKPPWVSGLANAEAMEVLLKTPDGEYIEKARLLLKSFSISIDSGGVALKESHDRWWYSEYVREKPPMVLNGMMIILLAIHDFYEKTGDSLAISLFKKGLNSLCFHLKEFDFRGLSRYDLTGRITSHEYHRLHIRLLEKLYRLTGCKSLKEAISRWRPGKLFVYRLVVYPNPKDYFVFGVNSVSVLSLVFLLQLFSKFVKK